MLKYLIDNADILIYCAHLIQVNFEGMQNITSAMEELLANNGSHPNSSLSGTKKATVFNFQTPAEVAASSEAAVSGKSINTRPLAGWKRLDDVIMGGQSESIFRSDERQYGGAVFEGILRYDGKQEMSGIAFTFISLTCLSLTLAIG